MNLGTNTPLNTWTNHPEPLQFSVTNQSLSFKKPKKTVNNKNLPKTYRNYECDQNTNSSTQLMAVKKKYFTKQEQFLEKQTTDSEEFFKIKKISNRSRRNSILNNETKLLSFGNRRNKSVDLSPTKVLKNLKVNNQNLFSTDDSQLRKLHENKIIQGILYTPQPQKRAQDQVQASPFYRFQQQFFCKSLQKSQIFPQQQKQANVQTSKNMNKLFASKFKQQILMVQSIIFQDQSNEPKLQDFHRIRSLGQGNYGKIYLMVHKQSKFVCAMKQIQKKKVRQDKYVEQILRELKIHSVLNHKNVVPLYGFFADQTNIYVLMELCMSGSLLDELRKQKTSKMPEEKALGHIRQISQGVKYIHDKNILHRDLKPENVMLNFGVAKICDFGWSVHNYEDQKMFQSKSGSPLYYAPEIVLGHSYNNKIDIWCIGMLLYECLIGKTPFKVYTENQLNRIVEEPVSIPDYIDVSYQTGKLMMRMLEKHSFLRPSVEDILKTNLLKKYSVQNQPFNLEFAQLYFVLLCQ